jgi:hypothetical protein
MDDWRSKATPHLQWSEFYMKETLDGSSAFAPKPSAIFPVECGKPGVQKGNSSAFSY